MANHGEILIKRAYRNVRKTNTKWDKKSIEYSIKEIHVSTNGQSKNTSDIEIVMDVMDTMNQGIIDTIVIVSSDSDFRGLATRVKEKGFEIIGFGEEKTLESLRNSYSSFFELPIKDKLTNSEDKLVIDILKNAINQCMNEDNYVLISQIGSFLKNQKSSYNAKNFGGNSWGCVFKKFPEIFEVFHLDKIKSQSAVKIK